MGSQLALYYALKKMNKSVSVINVDSTPKKYRYLQSDKIIRCYENNPGAISNYDLCLIFDTNDYRVVEPLYSEIKKSCPQIVFIDHHPVLEKGPQPSVGSFIETSAASTGELTYRLIQALHCDLDRDIARALYTSITFDTQFYRYIRNSPESHLIAAELLKHDIQPEEIHRHLFGNHTVSKIAFLGKALSEIEYYQNGKLAYLKVLEKDLHSHNLDMDDSRDVIDMIMNIDTLEAAILVREDHPKINGHEKHIYKVSLRSKGKIEVLSSAETIHGGGHLYSSGAFYDGDYDQLKQILLADLTQKLKMI